MPTTLAVRILMTAFPIAIMIGLIAVVQNDYLLALIYLAIIGISSLRYQKHDFLFLLFGLVVLFISEYLFISTGVEVFERRSLLGVMPIWLPLLWAYVFVAMKRAVVLFQTYL